MKDFFKTKIVTGLVVTATVILGGVAIFTALRLYQLRDQSVALNAPDSNPLAWDCSKYVFSLSSDGKISVSNNSTNSEPSQQAKLYINNSLVTTLDVPALTPGQNADLGITSLPQTGVTSWRIDGTRDCSNSGTIMATKLSCEAITFSIGISPTPTSSGTPSVTPTATTGVTGTPTPTSSGTPSVTPTATTGVTGTPTSTTPPSGTAAIEAAQQELPATGLSAPTLYGIGLGGLILLLALILAI